MPSIFSKNCILTGDVDSYCLVCTAHLLGDDVVAHIQHSKHNALLKTAVYFEKFKDDLIRKVKNIYFCELCNMTFPTAAKVGIHVTEETHMEVRRRQLNRVGTSIVFQKDTLIEERAWNGLVEDTCVLCNTEFDDCSTHVSQQSHVLHVITSTLTVDGENNIYRKVDGGYHCLTCNKILSENMITEHLKSTEHKIAVTSHDYSRNSVSKDGRPDNAARDVERNEGKEEANGDVSSETSSEDARTKTLSGNQSSNTQSKITNSGLPKDKKKPTPSNSITKEVETLAKQHDLSVNKYDNTVDCKVCSLQVPATLRCVKEHIAGKKHRDNSLKHSGTVQPTTKQIKKTNMKDFCTKLIHFSTIDGTDYVAINNEFCLKAGNFHGFAKMEGKIICQFCHIDIRPLGTLESHINSARHKDVMDNSSLITSLENEFVRQVKSDLYHCSYCGEVQSDFEDMLEHLATVSHKVRKADDEEMLQRFKMEEMIRFHRFMGFLAGASF